MNLDRTQSYRSVSFRIKEDTATVPRQLRQAMGHQGDTVHHQAGNREAMGPHQVDNLEDMEHPQADPVGLHRREGKTALQPVLIPSKFPLYL